MKSILKLSVVSGITTTTTNSPYYFSIMPTLELTNKEVNLLNSIFAAVADLDLNEHLEDEDDSTFDSLWDKVVKL